MSITENFMEEVLFYEQIRREHEQKMYRELLEEIEAEEIAYDKMAGDYFSDLELMKEISEFNY